MDAPVYSKLDEILGEVKTLTRGNYSNIFQIVAAIRRGDQIPNGTEFTVPHAVYGDIVYVTRSRNQFKLVVDENAPTVTAQPKFLLSANGGTSAATFQYDRPEAMFAAMAEAIPSGTVVQFTATAYGGWTAGARHFTASVDLPVGTMLCLNGYQNTALESLSVTAYASQKATTPFATMPISAGDGGATVDLGAWETDGNHPQRISYGSNNEAESNFFLFLNSDTGSGVMADIWEPQTKYDMMCTAFTSLKGFLGGFSDEVRACFGYVKIPNITNSVFESQDSAYTKNTAYTHNGFFFLPSRKEVYGSNETANEDAEVQFSYYKEIATANHDKLMYAENAANPMTYWLRTPYAGYAGSVRICHTGFDGALDYIIARSALGAAPLGILA
ncbi:MAG: hypothetical protein J6N19_15230 [Clostridium sp.]|nr:hypothetical protein [Clostridium sp.]